MEIRQRVIQLTTRRLAWSCSAKVRLAAIRQEFYEALASSEYPPDWAAGMSIGAINAAIIAGNTPENRPRRLRSFWDEITTPYQPLAVCARWTTGGLATQGKRANSADVRPARLFHPTFASGLAFTE